MKRVIYILIITILIISTNFLLAAVWNVSPNGQYKYCSEIANMVQDNDTILIEYSTYINDSQVTWRKNNLLIQGINGKPELEAGEKIANDHSNGKGIFVIQGTNTIVENIAFINSKVPDNNGAGIRQEGRNLIVKNCDFISNEMGILQGGTIANCSILIEYCNFVNNGSSNNPGYQHNIYINHIDSLIFRFNSSINASASGHELKSRANYNFIEYNRISNINSIDSRNIDISNGGTTIILGNIIEQGENSENSNIIGYAMEGATNIVPHNLYIVNNTIVNYKSKGNFVSVKDTDSLFFKNNICVGAKTGGFIIGNYNSIDSGYNLINDKIEFAKFKIKSIIDYELENGSPAKNTGLNINKIVSGHSLIPEYEYLIDFGIIKRIIENTIDIGAREFITNTSVLDFHEYKLYPNPASDYIKVNIERWSPPSRWTPSGSNEIKIYNTFGEIVMIVGTGRDLSLHRINIALLPTGIYFIQIGKRIEKFIKI